MEACSEEKEKQKQECAEKKQQRDELLKKAEEKARKAEEIKLNPPKRVRVDEVEHTGSDTILKPNESKRA